MKKQSPPTTKPEEKREKKDWGLISFNDLFTHVCINYLSVILISCSLLESPQADCTGLKLLYLTCSTPDYWGTILITTVTVATHIWGPKDYNLNTNGGI